MVHMSHARLWASEHGSDMTGQCGQLTCEQVTLVEYLTLEQDCLTTSYRLCYFWYSHFISCAPVFSSVQWRNDNSTYFIG